MDHLTFLGGPLILAKQVSWLSWPWAMTTTKAKIRSFIVALEFDESSKKIIVQCYNAMKTRGNQIWETFSFCTQCILQKI